jgi:hypothetical protein
MKYIWFINKGLLLLIEYSLFLRVIRINCKISLIHIMRHLKEYMLIFLFKINKINSNWSLSLKMLLIS